MKLVLHIIHVISLVYTNLVLLFTYLLLFSVVGEPGVQVNAAGWRRPAGEGIYDCQRPHEVKNFILSMSLYRYSMGLHEMEANGEYRLRHVMEGAGKKSRGDSW